jgi:transglutaminase-like putative cysteine protease
MNFEINHRTFYSYSAPVSQSYHLLHLEPRAYSRQTVLRHSLLIDPAPASRTDLIDDFGNPVSIITIEQDHTELAVHSRAQAVVVPPQDPDACNSPSWNDVAAQLRANLGPESFDAIIYTCSSRYIRPSREIYKFARPSFPDGRPLLEAVTDLTARIYKEFVYESGATDVATPVEEVLRIKRGVCQDFAHLEIACLRTMGLSVRYVSGYLLTRPPEGRPKLAGADASHAWISVWTPEYGWVDFDPTNNLRPKMEHIVLAFGRDFQDVSPVAGVLLGGGDHEVEVAVEVNQVAPAASPPRP